jgi:hypothetical protein
MKLYERSALCPDRKRLPLRNGQEVEESLNTWLKNVRAACSSSFFWNDNSVESKADFSIFSYLKSEKVVVISPWYLHVFLSPLKVWENGTIITGFDMNVMLLETTRTKYFQFPITSNINMAVVRIGVLGETTAILKAEPQYDVWQ